MAISIYTIFGIKFLDGVTGGGMVHTAPQHPILGGDALEKIEIILIYEETRRNLDDAVNIYAQRFPEIIRSLTSFHRTVKQFTTNGSVQPKKRVRRATVTGVNNKINVLAATAANPHASTPEIWDIPEC
ncbi:unnamed protein product [Brassicogethes aeneus]|uniref:DUF4817 domain-containing protein n=1 Tax=Brassicogethes aeneus TaxID=1431903 RepID=A0A9P0BCD4_BRAAE|nr:unnamed protein product [Brassicogethes aeneus]